MDIALKYRIAITASSARPAAYDLNKMRDMKMEAERILQAHELTHVPKHQARELSVESQEPDRNTRVILLPPVADERQAVPAALHQAETKSARSDAWRWGFAEV